MPIEYKHLSPEERQHFVEHGWLRVPNAIKKEYLDLWMDNLWVRLGWDKDDKSTWTDEYVKLPRHREVLAEDFAPEAWAKMCEIVGGEQNVDPVRERYYGDQLICNFGKEENIGKTHSYSELDAWHTDNDWYRQFLDSSGNALTIICCFTDVLPQGGGTAICEDGLDHVVKHFYDHPEGIDPPFQDIFEYCKTSGKRYAEIVANAGDIFITHGMLPHTHTPNHLHYARVISNPHLNMAVPFNLNRPDGDYNLCEQVILRGLGRESVPEYKPTRPRLSFYPRTAFFKRERVRDELARMLADAEKKGLPRSSVDSVYLQGDAAIAEHERRNGYDRAFGPTGVSVQMAAKEVPFHPTMEKQHVVARQIVV